MSAIRVVARDGVPVQESAKADEPSTKAGGGDNYNGMEARVARLEDDMKEVKSDLKAIRVDLSYLRGKVDSMPTTLQLIGFAVAVFVAAGLARFFAI